MAHYATMRNATRLTHCVAARIVLRIDLMSMTSANGQWHVPEFDIHDRLSKARRDAGIDQERMGQLLGCSRRTIVRYESKGPVPRSVILGYHVATQTDLPWLEHGTTPPDSGDLKLPGLDSNQEPIG